MEQSNPASNQILNMLWQVTKAAAQRDGQHSGAGADSVRRVAVLTHMGRPAAIAAANRLVEGLSAAGIVSALPAGDLPELDDRLAHAVMPLSKPVKLEDGIELMVVLGGDGTILRAAEWVVASEIPLLGVNLGHVGFLAEAESSEIDSIVAHVVARSYTVEERFTIDVTLRDTKTFQPAWSSYAINEVSIEKAARERMLEVLVEVDGRPLSRWACDGMLVVHSDRLDRVRLLRRWSRGLAGRRSTRRGTAQRACAVRPAAGAQPDVDGRCRSSRRLPDTRRGLVRRAPLRRTADGHGDRSNQGTAAAATGPTLSGPLHRSAGPEIRPASGGLARLSRPGHHRDRHSCMITELRIADLGVISDAIISLHPGLTVVTGETGAGKTMIISGLGLLLGGRADPRSVRRGSERARVEGRFTIDNLELAQTVQEAGGQLDDDELIVARHVTSAGRSRAYVGGAQVPASVCAELTAALVRIHGQAEQERLTEADRQRQLLDRFAGVPATRTAGELHESLGRGSCGADRVGPIACRGPASGSRD